MALLEILLAGWALLGHAIFWVGLANKSHATGFPRRLITGLVGLAHAGLLLVPIALAWRAFRGQPGQSLSLTRPGDLGLTFYYVAFCWLVALVHVPIWIRQRLDRSGRRILRQQQSKSYDVAAQLGRRPVSGLRATLLARVPGNQFLQLEVNEKLLAVPHLPPALEGFSLVHLSDLHFSGRVGPDYFRAVMERADRLQGDLVAITGDLCDKSHCVEWIPELLGPLESRFGKFCVLGNHDQKIRDRGRLHRTLVAAGCVDLGSETRTVAVPGGEIYLAGNELPWFAAAPDVEMPPRNAGNSSPSFRILLSHSPDQFAWARARDFDLVLAGHTHGGQIRLPLVGPVVCPSWSGAKYACGVFHEPPSILHVSRGISSYTPLRIRCAPELTKLILTRGGPEFPR